SWHRVPSGGAERVVPLVAGFLVFPVAFGVWQLLGRVRAEAVGTAGVVLGLLLVGWADGPGRPLARAAGLRAGPLAVGFTHEQEQVMAAVREQTTPAARILWDDTGDRRPGWNWTALLPLLTDRAYLGGLDPESGVEHSFCGMRDGNLNGRPLADWADADLA